MLNQTGTGISPKPRTPPRPGVILKPTSPTSLASTVAPILLISQSPAISVRTSAMFTARSLGNYRGEQSDDEFQRHNANRHHREESGQDRFGQRAVRNGDGAVLYRTEGRKMQGVECYHLLRCVGLKGPRDGQWVKEKDLRLVTTNWGESLFCIA